MWRVWRGQSRLCTPVSRHLGVRGRVFGGLVVSLQQVAINRLTAFRGSSPLSRTLDLGKKCVQAWGGDLRGDFTLDAS